MSPSWHWDPTLFEGTAEYYTQGRVPYSSALTEGVRVALSLDGRGRLIDVGCGPGMLALALAPLFEEVVGIDPDQAMIAEAEVEAATSGITRAWFLPLRAEDLSAGLGTFRVATFGQSFHWMEREQVAATIFAMLEPGGAFLLVNQETRANGVTPTATPQPPYERIKTLVRQHLGAVRRAGQGFLPQGTPDKEGPVIEAAGFGPERLVRLPGGAPLERRADDLVAWVLSRSDSAPHLFGEQLPIFRRDLEQLLAEESPEGVFTESEPDTVLRFWIKPPT